MTHRASLPTLIVLLAATLAGCGSLPDPMGWFEADNQAPPAELTDYEARVQVQTLWSSDNGAGSEGRYLNLVPTLYQGRVIIADHEGRIEALNAETGASIWTVETEAPISGGPGVGDAIVLVGTRDAEVIALKESDGEMLWRTRLTSEILSVPGAEDGVVVVHTIDGRLFGLSADSGTRTWMYDRSEPVLTLRGSSSPVIRGASVITGLADGKLVNLNLYSGDPVWEVVITQPRGRSELERIVDIDADPVVAGGLVFVCTFQGDVAAVSQETGVVLWRRQLSSHAGMGADWRQIYVTDSQDQVWALDPRNGATLWKQDKLINRRLTGPAVLEDYVLVGDLEGYVHWLSYEDGSQLARVRVSSSPITSTPRVVNGIAYVYADDGTLAALAPATPVENP